MIRSAPTSLALAVAVALLSTTAVGRAESGPAGAKARIGQTTAQAAPAQTVPAPLPRPATAPSSSQPVQAAKVTDFKLANGLEVVVVPDRRTPVVTHMIYYKVGSADEAPGKSGIAHFLEHLMFKGTEKNPSGRFSKMLATIGGQENAFTTTDYTGYFQRVPKEHLGEVMAFEADRMTGLVLTDANVLPERDVVLEEYNMRVANSPDARIGEQVAASLYLNHPYGRPVIGWRAEIEQLNREDALAFYKQFYGPNNAVVVIAGDVEPDAVKALAEKTYGAIAARSDIGPRKRPQEPPPVAVRQVTLDDPRVAQPSLNRSYLVPSYTTAKRGEAEAIDVLAQILGSGQNSRLYRRLVAEGRLATTAGAWYQGSAVDATRLGVYARPTPDHTLADVEKAIDAVIAETITDGVTADELERAKTRMIADAVYAQDNQSSMARWYGTALSTGSTVADVLSWPDRIRAVTADQVREAAKTWLDKRRSATGYLVKSLPASEEKRS
ncbi:M16 family metallopeptidase [Rhodoplanes azumiensis]|uniref:M16 family metallopeptidase n=1 Tax=Rhodoplanes azumiensis TaxID=1897628 RepID=A0ABW5AJ08_9BRAD